MIDIKNLSKNFEDLQVLKNINLTINKGEKVVIVGSSGSGKSTVLRCINKLEKPTSGEIWFNNKIVNLPDIYLHDDLIVKTKVFNKIKKHKKLSDEETISYIKENKSFGSKLDSNTTKIINKYKKENGIDINDARRNISMVFQHFNLFNNLSILDNLTLAPTINHLLSKDKATKKAIELLKRIDLLDKKDAFPSTLSGGQKQRIAIIRSLMVNPSVILFDEPTSALDPEMVKEVLDLMKELANNDITMIVVTHEMNFAREFASRILFMDDGVIIADETPTDFFNNQQNPRIKDFLEKVLSI